MTRHEVDIRRASGPLGGWLCLCQTCAWCPDVIHPTAQDAALAAARHTVEAVNEENKT